MSATVQRRVEALEAARKGGELFTAIVVKIVSPGQAPATAWRIEFGGQVYRSAPGESEEDFTSRVTAIAKEMHGNRPGIPSVILRADDADI